VNKTVKLLSPLEFCWGKEGWFRAVMTQWWDHLPLTSVQSRTLLSLRNQGGPTIAKPWKTVQPCVVDAIIFFTHSGPWFYSAMESSWPNDILQVLLLYTTVLVQQCDHNLEKCFASTAGIKVEYSLFFCRWLLLLLLLLLLLSCAGLNIVYHKLLLSKHYTQVLFTTPNICKNVRQEERGD